MSATTSIEWTDRTWNPATGCTKVSPGCKHCYAEAVAERFWAKQYSPTYRQDGELHPRTFTDVRTHPDRLDEPLRWLKPQRIFVNSMSDLFHEDVPVSFIGMVRDVISRSPRHVFQVLTKRPERMLALAREWTSPLRNLHLGVSVENQETANERIPLLLQTPAAVRFLSVEPLLGPVRPVFLDLIDWVIVGGESGPGARPCSLEWIRSIVEQCKAAAVPVFCKQIGANAYAGDRHPRWNTRDRKGGDMDEWPEDLRVREFPRAEERS